MPALRSSTGRGRRSRSEEHTSNSSHEWISYAVFCLKKKKAPDDRRRATERRGRNHLQLDGSGAIEVEADERPVTEAVAVRAHSCELSRVAQERVPAVRDAEAEQARRANCRGRGDGDEGADQKRK